MPRFPISVVQPQLSAAPVVERWTEIESVDAHHYKVSGNLVVVTLPQEFFVRELLDLDLGDDQAIVDVTRAYGLAHLPLHEIWSFPLTKSEHEAFVDWSCARFDLDVPRNTFRALRACSRHWIAALEERSVVEAWSAEGIHFRPGSRYSAEETAWLAWKRLVGLALEGLLAFQIVYLDSSPPNLAVGERPSLAAGIAIQLLNAIDSEQGVRYCENETCGRPFILQRGGAVLGQFRAHGVKYCEPACARAQANRAYRRRLKEVAP
jgi:hypothetical protein